MMNSNNQGKQPGEMKQYLILGIVTVCILFAISIFMTLFEAKSQTLPIDTPTARMPHINIPSVQYPTIPPSAPSFTISVQSIGLSGVTGTAMFEDISGTVAILLHIEEVITPVELRHGSCATLGALAYPLVSPDAGESETDLSINMKQLDTQKPLAVILYWSTEDRTAIACGDIP
jgi:hypothetical protein